MTIQFTRTIDAIKIDENIRVCIKRVKGRVRGELTMAKLLSEPERRANPSNHCVPVFDVFESTEPGFSLLVMPFLLGMNEPPFAFVDEVLDFVQQTLEVGSTHLHY